MSSRHYLKIVLVFVLHLGASGLAYAQGGTALEEEAQQQIRVDVTEDIVDPDHVDALVAHSKSLTVFTQDESDNLTYSLKFSPYNDGSDNRNFVHKVVDTYRKGISDRPLGFTVMNVFTVTGVYSWLSVAPIHIAKKIGIGAFQLSLQHFFFFCGNFWGKSIEKQVKATNWLLKKLNINKVIDEGKPIPRYFAVFNTAIGLSTLIRLGMNLDHFYSHLTNGMEYLNDGMTNISWVTTNFTWDYFSSQIDGEKYPDAKKFFSYYNNIRWFLVVRAVILAQALGGHNGRWAAMAVLLTHGGAGYLVQRKSDAVLSYLESKKLGERIEIGINYVKNFYLDTRDHLDVLIHPVCQPALMMLVNHAVF